jgi:hypothetical protein
VDGHENLRNLFASVCLRQLVRQKIVAESGSLLMCFARVTRFSLTL